MNGSSGLNVNYNIIEQSPQIKSLGSIADNNTSIYFDYINAHHNKGDFYNYSTTETYKCTTTLIKADEFFKDGFWSNYFRQFKYKDERKFII